MLEKLNGSMNVLAMGVIVLGVVMSFRQPQTGHDLIMGGLGCLGGSTAAKHQSATE